MKKYVTLKYVERVGIFILVIILSYYFDKYSKTESQQEAIEYSKISDNNNEISGRIINKLVSSTYKDYYLSKLSSKQKFTISRLSYLYIEDSI